MIVPATLLETLDDPHNVLDELCRRDFVSFLLRLFPYIAGGANLDPNWHFDAIAYQLARVRAGTCRRLLVTLPPRNLKSIMISVAWVAWCLGRNPSLNFVCVSYSNELSAKFARDCRTVLQAPWYRRLFPRTVLKASRSAAHDFETTAGGGRLATSITGTVTGRGGDILIIDDAIKPSDAMTSDAIRNGVNDSFASTFASRLNDKQHGAIIVVMQRLHQYDLAGMLIESGEWDELSFPAIATDDVLIPLTRGKFHQRRTGEALHPKREPLATLNRIKKEIGSALFAAQYQQQPVPAQGNMVLAEWLQRYDHPPERQRGDRVVASWDCASKDGTFNDWSVCVVALVRRRQVYIIDVFRARLIFPDLCKHAIRLARKHNINTLLIEDAASGQQLIQHLRANAPGDVPRPIRRKVDSDKVTRMSGQTSRIESGELYLPRDASWLAEFEQELLGFPSSKYDDQVDALVHLLAWTAQPERRLGIAGPQVGPARNSDW